MKLTEDTTLNTSLPSNHDPLIADSSSFHPHISPIIPLSNAVPTNLEDLVETLNPLEGEHYPVTRFGLFPQIDSSFLFNNPPISSYSTSSSSFFFEPALN